MPGKKTLLNFIHQRLNKVAQNLTSFCRQQDMEVLHQLRVDIKKINSLIRFCDNCNNSKLQKKLQPLYKIFRQLAEIREAQINLQLAGELIKPAYKEEQEQRILKQWSAFAAKQKRHVQSIEKIRIYLFKHLRGVSRKNTLLWFKKQLNRAEENLVNVEYHAARKEIKHILNVSRVSSEPQGLNDHYLKSLESALGRWHDVNKCIADLKKKKQLTKKLKTDLKTKEQNIIGAILRLAQPFKQKAVKNGKK